MNQLISPSYTNHISKFLDDGILKVYVDKPTKFTDRMLSNTDKMVSFMIKQVKKPIHAEVHFSEVSQMPELYNYASGLCIATDQGYTILVKESSNYKRWLYLHEWGHALGLEHPHDDSDGDVWEEATTNDTVMSYKWVSPTKGFRTADIDTITGLYKND